MANDRNRTPPNQKKSALGLQWKVTLLILAPVIAVLTLSSFIAYSNQRRRALANMSLLASQTGSVIENALQTDMLASDFEHIQAIFTSIGQDEQVRTLYMLDTSGNVIFAPNDVGVGSQLSYTSETCQPCHSKAPSERPAGVVVRTEDGRPVFRSMHPIEVRPECIRCHDPEQRLIGLLLTDFSIEPIEHELSKDLQNNVAWWIGTVLIIAVLANLAVNRWVIRRIGDFTAAIEGIRLDQATDRLPEEPGDEIGKLSAAFNAMVDRLANREKENRALSTTLRRRAEERGQLLKRLITAQEQERKRVARELHDDLGQSLSSTALSIEIAKRSIKDDGQEAATHLEHARKLIADASDRMYDMILGLRPSILDDMGLVAAVKAHGQHVLEPAGITLDLDTQGVSDRLPSDTEIAMFRIFQEALTNVIRHADASHVILRLVSTDGMIEGEIKDDGKGFDLKQFHKGNAGQRGLGLLGMQERAEQLGGQIEINSRPGAGTSIRVSIPITEASSE